MDKPDAEKPESILAGPADPSTESDAQNQPGPSKEKPGPTGQQHTVALKSDSKDSPPHTPSKKKKIDLSCFGKSPSKKAMKSSVKKEEPKEEKDLPKRERFRPTPLPIASRSVEEPPKSHQEQFFRLLSQMKITVGNSLNEIRETFKKDHPVKIYIRPTGFKTAPLDDDEDDPYTSPFFENAHFNTHNDMIKIYETQYFELSIRRLPEDENILKKLGICVQYVKSKCTLPYDRCYPCKIAGCRVCPHQFKCNCTSKFFDTEWCSHLHLAKRVGLQKYRKQAFLFISPTETNPTADRHLRAFVQGPRKMWEVAPNLWQEKFEYLFRSENFKVIKMNRENCICPRFKICKRCRACFCEYLCTCPDYWLYNQVCEHAHTVAMKLHENSDELFTTLGDYGENEVFEETALLDRGIDMKIEHETSFKINIMVDITQISETEWRVSSFWEHYGDPTVFTVTHEVQKDLCFCFKFDKSTPSKYCIRCEVCMYHYKCSCERIEKRFICYHVHAVARRYHSQREETEEERKNHINEITRRYDEVLDINQGKFIEREPLGPRLNREYAPGSVDDEETGPPQAGSSESNKVGPSEAVKDESTNDPAQVPMDESEGIGPSQADSGESNKVGPSEAVKDESTNDPVQEPKDESGGTRPSQAVTVESMHHPSQEPMDE